MKYEVRKIDAGSAARMLVVAGTAIGLALGFVLMVFVWLIGGVWGIAADNVPKIFSALLLGFVALFAMPILGAVVGFLCGYIGGGVYNFFSNWYGGLICELEETGEDID
ncbi:MAG: hypothetical protein WC712_06055 [Candidatus Brocadiia bacterium]